MSITRTKKPAKTTRWGRYALFGLAISFLIGTSNLWIDYIEKSRASRSAAEESRTNSEKTLQILTDISRTLNPFKDVRVDFDISYPFDDSDLIQYRQRLDKELRDLHLADDPNQPTKGVHWGVKDDKGNVLEVVIRQDSPLLPDRATEPSAWGVFSRRGLSLYWFKTPIDPTTFDDFRRRPSPDIEMNLTSDYSDKIEVDYDLNTKSIRFWGYGIQPRPETWRSTGKIISLLDLPGSQLIVELAYDSAVTFFKDMKRVNLPESIDISIGVAERSPFDLWRFKKYKGPSGTTYFVYLFPKTYAELLQHK